MGLAAAARTGTAMPSKTAAAQQTLKLQRFLCVMLMLCDRARPESSRFAPALISRVGSLQLHRRFLANKMGFRLSRKKLLPSFATRIRLPCDMPEIERSSTSVSYDHR